MKTDNLVDVVAKAVLLPNLIEEMSKAIYECHIVQRAVMEGTSVRVDWDREPDSPIRDIYRRIARRAIFVVLSRVKVNLRDFERPNNLPWEAGYNTALRDVDAFLTALGGTTEPSLRDQIVQFLAGDPTKFPTFGDKADALLDLIDSYRPKA
jgi:hypothetical protein